MDETHVEPPPSFASPPHWPLQCWHWFCGGRYYAWIAYRTPEEPFPVTAVYRPGGDPQYYLLVAGLAKGNLGDVETAGRVGDGVSSFPIVTSACTRSRSRRSARGV